MQAETIQEGSSLSEPNEYAGPVEDAANDEQVKFEFDEGFQSLVAAHALRNFDFMRRCSHLVRPEFFENAAEAAMVNLASRYFQKFQTVPDPKVIGLLLKEDFENRVIREDMKSLVVQCCRDLIKSPLSDAEYIEEKLVEFARHQAMSSAILKSVDLLAKKKLSEIERLVSEVLAIGANEDGDEYDYFERIKERTEIRMDRIAGKLPPTGITTGNAVMDGLLYHKGWGRKELACLMGGAKAGKSMALIEFAKSACFAGFNVLFVTLEVASAIAAERLDANVSDNPIKDLDRAVHDTRTKVEAAGVKAGKFKVHEFPSGSMSPSMLRKVIDRHKRKGIQFDLIVVDYADLMKPERLYDDPIENSRSIYVDLRSIAFEFNAAVLTATQTNREGMKSIVAKMEHIASDINKVRTVDVLLSINKTEEEAKAGEARIYFAASRNQDSGFCVFIKQDLSRAQFLKSVVRVE